MKTHMSDTGGWQNIPASVSRCLKNHKTKIRYAWDTIIQKYGWARLEGFIQGHGKWIALCFFIRNLSIFLNLLTGRKFYVPYTELPLTMRCTLRCKECANLMQYYEKPYDVPLEVNIAAMEKLLECVDGIFLFGLIGGEPFLYPKLVEIIRFLLAQKKIDHIMLTTNGTVIPDGSVLSALSDRRVSVTISDYGDISRNKKKLVEELERYGVKYRIVWESGDEQWFKCSGMSGRGRTDAELRHQFLQCTMTCRTILNGKLHWCPRSAHGTDLSFVAQRKEDYVDLLEQGISNQEMKKRIHNFLREEKDYIMACDHCDLGTPYLESAVPGEQMSGTRRD